MCGYFESHAATANLALNSRPHGTLFVVSMNQCTDELINEFILVKELINELILLNKFINTIKAKYGIKMITNYDGS